MAYLVKRGDVYHLSHCDTPTGKWTRFSTGLKWTVAHEYRQAKELEAEYTLKERKRGVSAGPAFRQNEKWDAWLPAFIAMKFQNKPDTAIRYRSVLRSLRAFFDEFDIPAPRHLTRQHCFDYFEWRKKYKASRGKNKACHNTALLEISALGTIMKEAVHRGYAPYNVCRELGIGRTEEKRPVELSDDLLTKLEACIQNEPEPYRTVLWRSYIMARKHGVRLRETCVNPVRDVRFVDVGKGEIDFFQKGSRKRTKPLHPDLVPMFYELQEKGETSLFTMPVSFASFWHQYFNKWKLRSDDSKVCFHSLRVTVQNKLRRAGVNDEIRRAYLSHETKADVHEIYSRIQVDELRVCHLHL